MGAALEVDGAIEDAAVPGLVLAATVRGIAPLELDMQDEVPEIFLGDEVPIGHPLDANHAVDNSEDPVRVVVKALAEDERVEILHALAGEKLDRLALRRCVRRTERGREGKANQ